MAVVVAVFGIITTFLVLVMERQRELALLQAIGASRRQILTMVLTESGLASLLSFILGAASGSALSLLLIKVINKQAFGWTIMLHWTPGIYWQSLLLVMSLGLGAAAYPAWRAIQPTFGGDFEGGIDLVDRSGLFGHRQAACATKSLCTKAAIGLPVAGAGESSAAAVKHLGLTDGFPTVGHPGRHLQAVHQHLHINSLQVSQAFGVAYLGGHGQGRGILISPHRTC